MSEWEEGKLITASSSRDDAPAACVLRPVSPVERIGKALNLNGRLLDLSTLLLATGDMDMGRHTVCVRVTDDFLAYSKSVGNDLGTPMPEYTFPGLNDGDIWCLCAQRWAQAYNAGKAPMLFLRATHEKTLDYIPLDVLKIFAIDAAEAKAVMDKLNLQRSLLDSMMSKGVTDGGDSFQ